MPHDNPNRADGDGRVVNIRTGRPVPTPPPSEPVDDLAKYQRSEAPDDYRHRMTVNIVAFLFIAGLIAAGIWLADTMAQMRKNQDCVLSGRRGCTEVDYPKDRW